jgi:hypothetical protein
MIARCLLVAAIALPATFASATCRIHNDTHFDFVVESGNTSNQQVSGHSETSIASGKIIGKSKDGQSISGSCKDGDKLEVTEQQGVPVMQVK